MTARPPVILLGFDAMEIERIDRLLAAGRLPNLARLRRRARYGRLQTRPPHFLSLVWATFYCSARMGDHAWYFNKLWDPDAQRLRIVHPDWLPIRPFWESLGEDRRVVILDLPYVTKPPARPNITLLNGWQSHDDFGRVTVPAGLWRDLVKRHGRPRMTADSFGPQTAAMLDVQRQEVLESDEQFANVCIDLMGRGAWDLFIAVFGSVHRGGHYLWDLSQIDTSGLGADAIARLRGARDDCYESADRQLGRILEAAPPGARVAAFALHGMGPNDGWYEMLPAITDRIHGGPGSSAAPKKGLFYRFKKALPWSLARQVTRRIPHAWNAALLPLWSRRMYHWPTTRFFTLPMDYNGYIRLNVRGREREGCVEPAAVDALIAELDEALRSFRDLETGRQVIAGTIKVDDLVGADAPRRRYLPDLVVLWDPPGPASASSGVVSERYGEVRWPQGRKYDSGRSGNHTSNGWFAAAGPGIVPGATDRTYDTADLIPTAFDWLGVPRPGHFAGEPIPELLGHPTPAPR